MATMTYSFDKKFDPWATEPDDFDILLAEELELENAKNGDDLSLEDAEIEEMELDESEFDK